jgi:hypothetical protein
VFVNGKLDGKRPKRWLDDFQPVDHGMNEHSMGAFCNCSDVTLHYAILMVSFYTAVFDLLMLVDARFVKKFRRKYAIFGMILFDGKVET